MTGPRPTADGFGLDNLPYGSVRRDSASAPALCVRLHDQAIELAQIADRLDVDPALVACGNLDRLLSAAREAWERLHESVAACLAEGVPESAKIPLSQARLCLPFTVGDYVDFYSSIEHATNVGRLFRPDAPLTPNWRHVPIGYHGRSGTVVVSGTPIRRPLGQLPRSAGPVFAPTERLDFELELAFVVGGGANELGSPLEIADVEDRIFGFVLVNDWSARDIQRWEYVPLGPFLGKSFATSISGWVVGSSVLAAHRVPAPRQDPAPLPYLRQRDPWVLAIDLVVELNGHVITSTSASGLYWTPVQQLVHCASNGTILRPGDLLASGTISGADDGTQGSLIELTRDAQRPIAVGDGARTYLCDGDEVVLRGHAGDVALGEVRGRIGPAPVRS